MVDKRFDGYMTLQYSGRSGVYVAYDDERSLLEGAWFWPAFPGPRIRFGLAAGADAWDHRYIAFNGTLAQRWMASGLFPTRPQREPAGRDYAAAFDEMLGLVERSGRWQRAKAVNLLEGILIDLAIDRAQAALSERWLEYAIDQLAGAADGFDPDYAAIARGCNMALSTLRRRFRDATGVPLHTFALQCRIDRAREMLGGADLPIKAIADRLGYRDVYYFSQQFRAFAGVSPGAFRRSRQS